MPFPRVKGQAYDHSNHVPLAIMWKEGIKNPGRTVDDYVSFVDMAPTFIELAGLSWEETGYAADPGPEPHRHLVLGGCGACESDADARPDRQRAPRCRRPNDWGYPIRGIIKDDVLYIHNFEVSRWPAGNPETGYLNTDGGPTKTEVLKTRIDPKRKQFWQESFGKRVQEELYDIKKDPDCLTNLANRSEHRALKEQLKQQLFRELRSQNDPRMLGRGRIFEEYPYANPEQRNFYERYMRGEKLKAGWVNESDFEKGPLD